MKKDDGGRPPFGVLGQGQRPPKTESIARLVQHKKKKLMHMSTQDYNSLGETLMQVMNNYLPSEQSKLQFISGKILDVFYDEFIKFIPPYILKREEEKRKKMENQGKAAAGGTA